jgi:acylphosphatase
MKTQRWVISGIVQGVGYRDWMVAAARRLGIDGWVRNRSDGTVEACVSGPQHHLADLLATCHRGPPSAQVSGIDVTDVETPPESGFRRRPTS